MPNDDPLMQAYEELRTLLAAAPREVIANCLRLSRHQTKLFISVLGDGPMRIEPSNFLNELLASLRASNWWYVGVLMASLE